MKAALIVALAVLAGLCCASQYSNRRFNDDSQQQQQQSQQQTKPFRSGNEYTFLYNGQIASGVVVSGPNNAPTSSDETQQKAVTRIQLQAKIAFESDQRAILRLSHILLGQLNDQIESPQKVQPMGKFETKQIESGNQEKLQLPLQFNYNDGVVESIQFHQDDSTWSKNIKRGVLNLIQLNLKRKAVRGESQQQQQQQWATMMDSAEQQYYQQQEQEDSRSSPFKTFTLPEITIEGECQTTYSINSNMRQQQQQFGDEQESGQQQKSFNVTKTIDFKKCNQIADVAFGFQTQQPQVQCFKCKVSPQQQQQEQAFGPQPQQQTPCSEECDPKEVKEQKLDRSTVQRFVLKGKGGPQQEYGIQRAELVSQYVYKNLRSDSAAHSNMMQTVVAAELVFQSSQQKQQQQGGRDFRPDTSSQKNTLLYDNEWDVQEKKFYMNGDEEFGRDNSPFAKVSNKVDQALQIVRKLAESASDKLNGIEYTEAVKLQRLVEVLRMCTQPELKSIFKQLGDDQQSSQRAGPDQQKKAEKILYDALAIAGTRNTIKELVDRIQKTELSPEQAVHALKQLSNLPAPSDKQADIVLNLCKSELAHRFKNLKQACWLTFGSMVGELCQQKTQRGEKTQLVFGAQSGYNSQHQCSPQKKQQYKRALMELFEQAQQKQATYEMVLALKALGNAGIDTTAQSLEQIIHDRKASPIVRTQAIDALRRLRTKMSRKIQRILLPVFQNTRDQPTVRMAAFAMIIHSNPDRAVLDQVTYTLAKERNPQVQSIVYTALKALTKSKIPSQQQIANQLKTSLKLANVDEQTLQASQVWHIPIYSNEQKEGVFINLVSAYATRNNLLPNHLSAIVNTMVNDEFELNALKVSLTQQGVEQWYEGLIQSVLHAKSQGQSQTTTTRGQRSSVSRRGSNEQELRNIFKGLSVKSRRSSSRYSDSSDSESSLGSSDQAFAMATVRIGDVDIAIVDISRQNMPKCLKALANGQRPSLSDCLDSIQEKQHFRSVSAMNLYEKWAKIPTSMGVPLRIQQSMPILAAIEGQLQANPDRSEGIAIKAQMNLHPSLCVVHMQMMETWSPMVVTGVESTRALELNIPIVGEIHASFDSGLKAILKTPAPRTRLLGFHSLPVTYTRDFDTRNGELRKPKVKAIQVPQLEQLQRDIDTIYGKHATGMPMRIQGHFHRPANPSDYKQLIQLAMCTENHVHVKYEPTPDDSPKEIVLRAEPAAFSKTSRSAPALDNFYSKDRTFDANDSEEGEFEDRETHDQRRSKLNSFLNQFQSPMYKHSLKLSAETKGGRKQARASITTSASCDSKFKFCRMTVECERTPMFANEKSDWSARLESQILCPEPVSNVQQLQQSQDAKNRKLVIQGEAEWGSQHKQTINFRIQGEKAHKAQWRQQISSDYSGPQQKFQQKQAAFLNKYDLVAEYKLGPQAQNIFKRSFEALKGYAGFWNTQEEQKENGRDGQVRASFIIDPITQQHANITVKTPNHQVKIETMELPLKIRPFSLVRPADKASHTVSQLFSRYAVGAGRAECSVDGKRVETFDDVLYKAPIGQCYSVLAKDCSNEEQPQFAVMMKTLSNGQDKKIKVVTPDQIIECKPAKKSGSSSQKQLECAINGQTIQQGDQEENTTPQGQPIVEYNNDEQTDVTINVEGVQVRFGCWGSQSCKNQKAWIKLSSMYKEGQCGLCGHYDDEADNELRMANSENTRDVEQFHRSYTLRNSQDEDCANEDQDAFYKTNNKKFRGGLVSSNDEDEMNVNGGDDDDEDEYNFLPKGQRGGRQQQQQEQDQSDEDDWQAGAYHTDGSSSEEDQWGRHNSRANKRWMKKMGGRRHQQQQQEDSEGPVPSTKVLEYSHKVCFSVSPVMQCPPGSYPTSGQDEIKKKIQFACLSRADSEARQMQRQASKGVIVDMSRHNPSFVENVTQPTRCEVY